LKQRLQKLISASGIASRRKAELLINEGLVKVNQTIASLGDKADPQKDDIFIKGVKLNINFTSTVILLNKPKGVICSCKDTHGRKTILDLLPYKTAKGLHPIGRLDQDSRGAILLTNNGSLTFKLTHPKYNHKKEYLVWIKGTLENETLNKWRKGLTIEGCRTKPASINKLKVEENMTLLNIFLTEGKKRQIRISAKLLGYSVIDLQRVSIGKIKLNQLKEGEWRFLNKSEWVGFLND